MLFKLDRNTWRQVETNGNTWKQIEIPGDKRKYMETDRNRQLLSLSISNNNQLEVTSLEEAFFRLMLKKHSVLSVMFVFIQ
ncbi:hypothetical protein DMA11_19985 [Marinilabiliaceae bacterium JC017]|nr:hypothetical protein DMA11_19985 [Marinilabiliaceae bacterium JC017]